MIIYRGWADEKVSTQCRPRAKNTVQLLGNKQTSMKKLVYSLAIIQGLAFSVYFGVWSIKDYVALEHAVAVGAQNAEMRHRINVGFDGVWYLLSNMLVLSAVKGLSDSKKEKKEA